MNNSQIENVVSNTDLILTLIKDLSVPIWTTIIASFTVYLLTQWNKRRSIHIALLKEINFLLDGIDEMLAYFQNNDHYWLQVGKNLENAPKDGAPLPRLFHSQLSSLYLLKSKVIEKTLNFYMNLEACENHKKSLFMRIDEYARKNKPLTKNNVQRLSILKNRVRDDYQNLVKNIPRPLKDLSELPENYQLPKTNDIAKKVNETERI